MVRTGSSALVCRNQRIDAVDVLSPLVANQAVAFANMSRSVWTWRNLRRSSTNSWRSLAQRAPDWLGVVPLALLAWRIQFMMLVAWQPNSFASSPGFLPALTNSTICSRNCAEYGFPPVCGLNTSDSFYNNNKVAVRWGSTPLFVMNIIHFE